MRPPFWHNVRRFWPIAILLVVEFLLAAANFLPGTYLMGWDNVMPEFNLQQALTTNIFGVWQEHRGVGLPDGMGHAANLIHTAIIWLMSFTLPQNMLRYAFQFLMHALGMIGMYMLLRNWQKERWASLVGGLFYGLNLITIQMFYTPLEAFSVHFAALPWLAYSLLRYFQQPSRNTLLLFITISILTTPQYFIPTLMLPITILLAALTLPYLRQWKQVLTALGVYLAINAFWLLPYLINVPHNAPIIQSAKINQMSSEEVYERNRAFGDIKNVLLIRGFMLDFEDVNAEGQPIFVMDAWRNWINNPSVTVISTILVGMVLLGLLRAPLRWKLVFAIPVFFLANNTPGISDGMNFLRDRLPLFAEAYRFPFTKFGLLYAFAGSVLLIYGIQKIKYITFITAITIVMIALPIFQGYMFYDALRVKLPNDYLKLFAFMQKQDRNGRTAYLPQPSYWSWKHYNFGYVGSGFLWYGISQPLMDRAFDPWSRENENYYWELSYAVYKKDPVLIDHVLTTYDIRYIILDSNLHSPSHDRALFTEETKDMLSELPNTRLIGQFGSITVYAKAPSASSFIRITDATPDTSSLPYPASATKRSVNERDTAFQTLAEEITRTNTPIFSSQDSGLLTSLAVKPCGVLKRGVATGDMVDNAVRMSAQNQRACLSIGDNHLPHAGAYLVAVTYRHITGRPLMFSIINNTAKHVELETLLTKETTEWQTDYFLLPPLAPDGLGYTAYFTNDAIGSSETINDIQEIAWYDFPYPKQLDIPVNQESTLPLNVSRPVPFYYRVRVSANTQTVVLSQAYNPNWIAFSNGKLLRSHFLIDNWANGWEVTPDTQEVIIIFWPQLLQYAGFLSLILPVLLLWRPSKT